MVGHPAEDQERREDHVENDGRRLHHHAGLEVPRAAQSSAHRDERELERHRRHEPAQVLVRARSRVGVGGERARVSRAQRRCDHEEHGPGQHREHKRLVEDQESMLPVLAAGGMRDQRGRADPEHLRERQDQEHQVPADPDRCHRLLAQATHPVEVHQVVEGLEEHRDQHEAGGLEQVARDRAGRQIVQGRCPREHLRSAAAQANVPRPIGQAAHDSRSRAPPRAALHRPDTRGIRCCVCRCRD